MVTGESPGISKRPGAADDGKEEKGQVETIETDVIVIGGGATGTGIARDLSLRGVPTVLVEKDDIASGTTGRSHGLLHSGARYAVKDMESAVECIQENRVLKRIANHCIEDTGGLFVTLPDDDPAFHDRLLTGCRFAGIPAREISKKEALRLEEGLNPGILSAIMVPDGTIDPFRLAASNMLDAQENGARVFTHSRVNGILVRGESAAGITFSVPGRDDVTINGKVIINASGIWAQEICRMAGIEIRMLPSKGSMLIIDYRVNRIVVNRCRPPADGDIIVPGDTVTIIGTTSRSIDYRMIDLLTVDDDEINILYRDGSKLLPAISKARALRAYAGVRPLLSVPGAAGGRDISRGIVLIDHETRDGMRGLITIVGGKLMTYRLMAEKAADLACQKLGVAKKSSTASRPLPGSGRATPISAKKKFFPGISRSVIGSAVYRHGERVMRILKNERKSTRLICECEMVTEGEVEYALSKLGAASIIDLRRRTRVGMGPCQGELCSYRCAGLMNELGAAGPEESLGHLASFLEERWKGVKPVFWGDSLREQELTYWIYQGLFGLGDIK